MDGIDYPYSYKIERALYFDHVDVFIYTDENTEVKTAHDIYGGYEVADDMIYCRYNEEAARYEISYNLCYPGTYKELFQLVNKETGVYREYFAKTLNHLEGLTDVGEINEREYLEKMHPVLKAAFTEAYGENFTLENGDGVYTLRLTADDDDTGIIRIELIQGTDINGEERYYADIQYDEPMPPLSMEEFVFFINFTKSRQWDRRDNTLAYSQYNISVDKGTVNVDFINYPDIGEKVVLHLYGFQKEIKEGGGGYVPDSYYLWYNKEHKYFNLWYTESDGRHKMDGMKFDLNYKLIK